MNFNVNRNGNNGELLPYSGVERLVVPLTLLLSLLNKDSVSNQVCFSIFNFYIFFLFYCNDSCFVFSFVCC